MSPTSSATWLMPTILGLRIAFGSFGYCGPRLGASWAKASNGQHLHAVLPSCQPFTEHRPEETLMSAAFDLRSRFASDVPDPSPRFGAFPKYNFVGGHNDPERIPIEGLIEATA